MLTIAGNRDGSKKFEGLADVKLFPNGKPAQFFLVANCQAKCNNFE